MLTFMHKLSLFIFILGMIWIGSCFAESQIAQESKQSEIILKNEQQTHFPASINRILPILKGTYGVVRPEPQLRARAQTVWLLFKKTILGEESAKKPSVNLTKCFYKSEICSFFPL